MVALIIAVSVAWSTLPSYEELKLSPNGQVLLLKLGKTDGKGRPKSGSGPGELNHPFDVAVDGNGDIYVADSGNRRIQVFTSAGMFLRQFGQGSLLSTSEIRGIALTNEGLWVSDKESERIYLFGRAGGLIKSIGDADRATAAQAVIEGQAQFEQLSIMLGGSDNIALRVGGRNRIREMIRENQSAMPVFATAPMVIQESLLFPYLSGADFVQRFKERKGKANPLTNLPRSTEQILHTTAYFGTGLGTCCTLTSVVCLPN